MNRQWSAVTGIRKDRDTTVRYELHRERESGHLGVERPPLTEEFYGLDRARIAALAYALDGPTTTGERLTGVVRIYMVLSTLGTVVRRTLIDVIDERVAARLLTEVRLPHADDLAVSLDELQASVDWLLPR